MADDGNDSLKEEEKRLLVDEESLLVPKNKKPENATAAHFASINNSARLSSFGSHTSESSVFSRGWSDYNDKLESNPLLVKAITAFFVLGFGDAVAQVIENLQGRAASPGWDCPRTLRFGVFGLLGAPWSHYYYHALDSALPPTLDPFTCRTLLKVFIDQFIQAPCLLCFIIVALDLMKAEGLSDIKADLSEHYWDTLVTNCK